jgi:hypothetical protein
MLAAFRRAFPDISRHGRGRKLERYICVLRIAALARRPSTRYAALSSACRSTAFAYSMFTVYVCRSTAFLYNIVTVYICCLCCLGSTKDALMKYLVSIIN